MNSHILLFAMFIIYLCPIIYIYTHYDNNNSISSIISTEKHKYIILFFMILMGIVTYLYEHRRNNIKSLILIMILLISIYILIYYGEEHAINYLFANIAFISILAFMLLHYNDIKSMTLLIIICIQIILLILIIVNTNKEIFFYEILYLINFARFYIFIHFI